MWNHDQPPLGEKLGHPNLYGTHPYYTVIEDKANVHSVLVLNANAQEVRISNYVCLFVSISMNHGKSKLTDHFSISHLSSNLQPHSISSRFQ